MNLQPVSNQSPVMIVMAEDDSGHATLIQRNMKRAGLTNPLVHLKDGQEVLDFVMKKGAHENRAHDGPIVVLLDIKMPRVDGVEVLRRLKEDKKTVKIPVIMISTTDDAREIGRCYELGCAMYITKPVSYEAFVEAIHRLGLFLQVVRFPVEREAA